MASKEQLIERWDSFLAKIESRFNESLQQAEEAILDSLEENGFDDLETSHATGAIVDQIEDIIKKIDETWDDKVEAPMREVNEDDFIDEAMKGQDLTERLRDQLQDFRVMIEGKVAKECYQHVLADGLPTFECSQCGKSLTPVPKVYSSHYVTCDSCNTVNTFSPDAKYAMLGGLAIPLTRWKLHDLYKANEEADTKLRRDMDDDLSQEEKDALYDAYYEIYMNYHRTYQTELGKLNASVAEKYDQEVERAHQIFENQIRTKKAFGL